MKKFVLVMLFLSSAALARGEQEISFAHQIRPLLSRNCLACHGPDQEKRKAKLRLDIREEAIAAREDGPAILPGNSFKSAMYTRITSSDPDERMPPVDSGHKLNTNEIDLLRQWIDGGAQYEGHWAFTKPERTESPLVRDKAWPQNELDTFVLSRLEAENLRPAQEADRYTLIRRLSFDLTGLPPSAELIAKFVNDKSPEAYGKLVDELLASPHYGERWARVWMDLARYADTQGYEKDRTRTVWPWRDWLIKAFNDDMPYDQFTIEQLAGDLLPNANSQQILATVFHRNTMTNTEGGTDDEEFRIAAVKDRVDTTGVIWLGLSLGCAKCHSHKYDPISQMEYYRLFAFFNQSADADRFGDEPVQALPSPFHYRQHAGILGKISIAQEKLKLTGPGSGHEAITKEIAGLKSQLNEKVQKMKLAAVPIMQELPEKSHRRTRILNKGDYLNPGDEVEADVPEALHPMDGSFAVNRLGMARWLMDRENPLTARVMVNRIWSRMFGAGLVETEEDFGTQGALPSHPQLLDWLAIEFAITHRWSLKKLCRTIVMSATYRQSSQLSPELLKRDPRNRLLARGARFRLEAEMIRDQALAVSGLLSRKVYGPPVMPPQPEGIWKTVYNSDKWVTSKGEDRYRRGLYTFAKRTSAYPSFLLLDAGSGEVCLPRRIRTNTATAALAALNDPVHVEAAQALARRVLLEANGDASVRAAFALRIVTGRPQKPTETGHLVQLFKAQLAHYLGHKEEAVAMATVPLGAVPENMDTAQLAAWTVVASVLLNLDEILTKG